MVLAISDSSTLIHLSKIGRLDLLKDFYGSVTIPLTVWKEVVLEGEGRDGAEEVTRARDDGWIQIDSPKNSDFLILLRRELDDGEAEAIALAVENSPSILLVDETDARKIARLYNVAITGVLGILIRAKAEKKIDSLRDVLDALLEDGGFWVSNELYSKVLKIVGE